MTTKLISVQNAGEQGIIKDVDPILLPPNAWTGGNNVRFYNNEVQKILGQEELQDPTLTDVQFIMPATKWASAIATPVWIYAGLDHVYYTDDGVDNDDTKITRQGGTPTADIVYTGASSDRWNGCVNQNVLILNNGKDSPQGWTSTILEDLRWDAGNTWEEKNYTTKVIRSFKNFLIALQFDDGSLGMNPNTVYWSEPAEPWAVPTTWDTTDTSSISGKVELSATEGQIIDGLGLKDSFIIYKDTSIYNMTYAGGQYVWQFRDVSKAAGLLSQGAVVEVLGQHVFMAQDDIIITDGYQLKSILSKKVKSIIFSEIDSTLFARTFAVPFYNKEEIWFCYATTGSSYINRAAIWNYTSGAWTFRDLPNVNFLNYGVLFSGSGDSTWASDSDSWDSDSSVWNESVYNPVIFRLLGATNTSIKQFDTGYTFDSTGYSSYVERTGLKLGDSNTMKRITAIYPKGEGAMNIYVGHAMHQSDPLTWEGPFNIDPSTDAQIRCRVTGRYHGVRFEFTGDTQHTLQSYDIEYVDTGYGR